MGIGRSKQQATVLCVGLDGAGKSTMINYLKPPARKVRKSWRLLVELQRMLLS